MKLASEVLQSYSKIDEQYVDSLLAKEIEKNNKTFVVLDDDPTGVQTVHDVPVYTNWEKDTIRQAFAEKNKLFFILTNSRGFTAEQTTKAHKEIADVVDEAAQNQRMQIPVGPHRMEEYLVEQYGRSDFGHALAHGQEV